MVLRHSNESRRTLGKFFVGTVQFGLSTKPYGFLSSIFVSPAGEFHGAPIQIIRYLSEIFTDYCMQKMVQQSKSNI